MKHQYFPEIDFLRAVAVLSVIFFHFDLPWVTGGFFGVDIFFVISGYLITTILMKDIESPIGTLLAEFYLRRVKRIFPVFFVVCLTTLFVAYFFLLPSDYLELAYSSLSAISFVSNIYFYFNTGYFDGPAEMMPMLHTWSLSVEEQFYLFWPIFIFFILKKTNQFKAVVIVFTSSIVLVAYCANKDPSLVFYNFPFRVYEFTLGAIVALFLPQYATRINSIKWLTSILQFCGLTLIVLSLVMVSSHDNYLWLLSLIPILGASLYIVGSVSYHTVQSNLFNNPIGIFIGKISFSLYLWHWPVVIFYKNYYQNQSDISVNDIIYLFVVILSLSVVSYYFVEQPFRSGTKRKMAIKFSGILFIVTVLFSCAVIYSKGFHQRTPDLSKFASMEVMYQWDCPHIIDLGRIGDDYCNFGRKWNESEYKIILWGDSHALHLAPLFQYIASNYNLSFLLVNSCRPIPDGVNVFTRRIRKVSRRMKECIKSNASVLKLIENDSKIKLVVLAGGWVFSENKVFSKQISKPSKKEAANIMMMGLSNTISDITSFGVSTLIMGDTPHPVERSLKCASKIHLLRAKADDCKPIPVSLINNYQGETEAVIKRLGSRTAEVTSHSIIDSHCRTGTCPIFANGLYIYRDDNHLRQNFSTTTKESLVRSFGLDSILDWKKFSN